jgi:CHASE1-domain containing sensor protein
MFPNRVPSPLRCWGSLLGVAVAAVLLAQPLIARADPRSALPPPSSLSPERIAPDASRSGLDDGFARRRLFAPGRRMAVSDAVPHETSSSPQRRSPLSSALFGLGGALVALGVVTVVRGWKRGG